MREYNEVEPIILTGKQLIRIIFSYRQLINKKNLLFSVDENDEISIQQAGEAVMEAMKFPLDKVIVS